MQELSLYILDITQNSLRAGATRIDIEVEVCSEKNSLTITITDNGKGMGATALALATNPFYTTRSRRGIGLGLPLFAMSAEMTGGSLVVESTLGIGTKVSADYGLCHVDRLPMGDLAATVIAILQSGQCGLILCYKVNEAEFYFDSREASWGAGSIDPLKPRALAYLYRYIRENIHNCNKAHPFYY